MNDLISWWLSPLSGSTIHIAADWMVWHARVMVVSWSFLLPLGVLVARYFKVTAKQDWPNQVDNRFWWNTHRLLQYSGVALMLAGMAIAWNKGAQLTSVATWHFYLGWTIAALGGFQVVGAWLRGSKGGPTDRQMRGDHYDMTPHRLWFENLHKTIGWAAVLIAIAAVVSGLLAADAPRWMALVLTLWWLTLLMWGMRMQRAGRSIDTYQAIWGPDKIHPGNNLPHPGWGMKRLKTNLEK
jgi:hypothetical protein